MPLTRSSGSVKVISLDRREFIARLRTAAARLVDRHPEVDEVWLFGSIARGDHTGTSDADVLLVLGPGAAANPLDRLLAYLPDLELDRRVDILPYTREELETRRDQGDAFFRRVLAERVRIWPHSAC
jgi:uncharacterized protein